MIYYSVKKNGIKIEPDFDTTDGHFAWCVARVVETLNYYQEPERTAAAFNSFISDMNKNSACAVMLKSKDSVNKFLKQHFQRENMTANHVGGLIIKIAKEHGYECYLGKEKPSEEISEKTGMEKSGP